MFRKCISPTMSHMSHVMCPMLCVILFFLTKLWTLSVLLKGILSTGPPTLVYIIYNTLFFCRQREEIDQIRSAPDIFPPGDIQNIKHLSFINILLWWYSLSNHTCIIPQYFHKDCIIDFKFISKVESQTNIFFEKFSSCSFYMNIF